MNIGTNEIMTINDILVNFDFEKVGKIMETVGWKWELPKLLNDDPGDSPPKDTMTMRAPTGIEMRRTVRELIASAMADETNTDAGGFEVVFKWTDKEKKRFSVTLNFVPEDMTITTNCTEETQKPKQDENDQK